MSQSCDFNHTKHTHFESITLDSGKKKLICVSGIHYIAKNSTAQLPRIGF